MKVFPSLAAIFASALALSGSLARADGSGGAEGLAGEFGRASTLAEMAPFAGARLGVCEDSEGYRSGNALFVGSFRNSQGKEELLAFPASLTSRKQDLIESLLIKAPDWNLARNEVASEKDRNGNRFMYSYARGNDAREFTVVGTYEKGIDPCRRYATPEERLRKFCNPPEALFNAGFGLDPMVELSTAYRLTAKGQLISQTKFRQAEVAHTETCVWD